MVTCFQFSSRCWIAAWTTSTHRQVPGKDGLLPHGHRSAHSRCLVRLRERWETSSERAGAKLSPNTAKRLRGATKEGRLHPGKCSFSIRSAADGVSVLCLSQASVEQERVKDLATVTGPDT